MTNTRTLIKTGAQKIAEIESEFGATTDEEQLLCYKEEATELRAAYEALQKENENLAYRLNNAQDSAIKALEENAEQSKRIAELEAASNPYDRVDLQGNLYITGLHNQIESLRKQVEEHKEWHMIRDEMRKALEMQMNGGSK